MTSDDVMFDDINLYERLVCQTYLRLWNGDTTRRVATSLFNSTFHGTEQRTALSM